MYGINTHAILPMRAEDSEKSEMVSQLLFGEFFHVAELNEKWCYINSFLDDYKGWVDRKMITFITEKDFNILASESLPTLIRPLAVARIEPDNEKIYLSGGSLLPGYIAGKCIIQDKAYYIPEEDVAFPSLTPETNLIDTALSFLNTPYLWGGKNLFGMDCSGFVQIVYRINGILLPRDAGLQYQQGEIISDMSDVKAGDLAFFVNPQGNVAHVGIALGNREVIHAYGKVRIDRLDGQGIFNLDRGSYTHRLACVKRYF